MKALRKGSIRRTVAIAAWIVASVGCSPEKKRAYEQLSSAINPVIVKLMPTAHAVLGPHSDHASVYRDCSSADDALRSLSEAPIQESLATVNPPGRRGLSLLQYAQELMTRRAEHCSVIDESCTEFCRRGWQGMVDEVQRLQAGAEVHDVLLLDLGP